MTVLYGRRRCGKSRLVQEALHRQVKVYYLADLRDAAIQREAVALEIARLLPGFEAAAYPDWTALLRTWKDRAPESAWLALDEFPYLAQVSPELPSVVQKSLEEPEGRPLRILLCGSSQRMMHGLVLDRTAPLYGRASEILKIGPMPPPAVCEALALTPKDAVVAYAIWGGLPRNWELAADYRSTEDALKALVLDPNGVLHGEPPRLLLDDMRSAVQANSLLTLVGQGCNRLSEIAGRLGQSATNLSRPLQRLVDLGYVRREIPFGESIRSTKRSLYRLDDPFLLFWYRFIAPNASLLENRLVDPVYQKIVDGLPGHVGDVWEALAGESVPKLRPHGIAWGPASRWWGRGLDGAPLEIDVAAASLDGRHLLLGEVQWSERSRPLALARALAAKAARFPMVQGRNVHHAVWVKKETIARADGVPVFGPGDVMR